MAKKKAPKLWLPTASKAANPKIPDLEKQQVEEKCQAFIEKKKPQWVQPADDKWGYVYDVYGKWYRSYFYFCATYRYEDPEATMPESEVRFARLEYAGPDWFHLSYFRHTGQWWEVYRNLSLKECLHTIEHEQLFWP